LHNGNALAFQARVAGSIPAARSTCKKSPQQCGLFDIRVSWVDNNCNKAVLSVCENTVKRQRSSAAVRALFHPDCVRLIALLKGRDALTTSQLGLLVPKMPIATLYRHLAAMRSAGIIHVVKTTVNRGPAERTYSLASPDQAVSGKAEHVDPQALEGMVNSIAAVLIDDFQEYARSAQYGNHGEPVFRIFSLDATKAEYEALSAQIEALLATPFEKKKRVRSRRRFYFAAIPNVGDK
jgi:hypothetical protein